MSSFLTNPNSTHTLANFLRTWLNSEFAKEIAVSQGSIPEGSICVKTAFGYDKFNVSNADLPCLKVYKNRDNFKKGTLFRISDATITYTLGYPNLDVLPNLLDFVSYKINSGLLMYSHDNQHLLPPPNEVGYVGEYLLTVNDQTGVVMPFLRFNIQFKNFCDNSLYQK